MNPAGTFNLVADAGYLTLFVASATVLSLAGYFVTRLVAGKGPHDEHREMASAMVNRIGALHGLILALVFAQEMSAYQRLDSQTALEASAVADIFNDAGRYDRVGLAALRGQLIEYVRVVIDKEWAELGSGRGLDGQAWALWNDVYERTLSLNPTTPREQSLRDHMLDRIHAISSSRDMRQDEASNSLAGLFWFAALSGVVLIAMGHYIYTPKKQNVALLCLFSTYTGVILFLIFAFSNPYSPPGTLSPAALIDRQQELTAAVAGPTP